MRFKEYYTEELSKGDVVHVKDEEPTYIVVDITDTDYKLLDYDTKTKTKVVPLNMVTGKQSDLFGGKASTEKKEKPKAISAPKPKEVPTKQMTLFDDVNPMMKSVLDAIDKHSINTIDHNDNLYVMLYHGTSKANLNKILKSGKFKAPTYFSHDEDVAKKYAKVQGHKSPVHTMAYVNADSLAFDGNYFSTQRDVYEKQPGLYS